MTTKRLLAVAVAILALRVILIATYGMPESPLERGAQGAGDHIVYHHVARALAVSPEEWFKQGSEFGFRAPLYFTYLASVYHFLPHPSFTAGQILNAVLGALNAVLMFFLIRNVEHDSKEATSGMWMRGLLPFFIVADTFVMSETLLATLLLSALLVVSIRPQQPTMRQASLLGLIVACCMLTRESSTSYLLIFGGYLWIASETMPDKMARLTVFLLVLVIALIPWMWRNNVVWGTPLPLTYTAGPNLHVGNHPASTGKYIPDWARETPLDVKFGTPEYSRYHLNRAVAYIKSDPVHFLAMGFKKLAWFFWPSFLRDDMKGIYDAPPTTATRLSFVMGGTSASLMILGLIGFGVRKRDYFWWLSAVLIAYTAALSFVAIGSPRFRDPVDQLLVIYAAYTVVHWRRIWDEFKRSRYFLNPKFSVIAICMVYLVANWLWIASQLGV